MKTNTVQSGLIFELVDCGLRGHAVHAGTGMPVDLFVGRPENWWSLMVCRTGPAALNIEIAMRAKGRGLHWDPYRGLINTSGRVLELSSEEDLFRAGGIAYATPMEREILWGGRKAEHELNQNRKTT